MAWNEPGGNNKDPWGGGNRNNNDGPPDLDELLRKLQQKLNGLFGGRSQEPDGSSGGGASFPWSLVLVVLAVLYGLWGFYQVDANGAWVNTTTPKILVCTGIRR